MPSPSLSGPAHRRLAHLAPLAVALLSAACSRSGEPPGQIAATGVAAIEPEAAAGAGAAPVPVTPPPPPPKPDPGPQGLVGYRWQILLATAADGRALPELQPNRFSQIHFEFDPYGRLTIDGLCGERSGDYRLRDGVIEVPHEGQQALGCEDKVAMATSDAADKYLVPPYRYRLEGQGVRQRLHLTGHDGTQLVLQTEDAFWGSRPVAMTLEVAAKEVDCQGLLVAASSCLWVREVRYLLGRRIPVSDWHRFYGPIQGYRHTPGRNERVHLRHYPLRLRGGSVNAYVLERVEPLAPSTQDRDGTVGGEVPQ